MKRSVQQGRVAALTTNGEKFYKRAVNLSYRHFKGFFLGAGNVVEAACFVAVELYSADPDERIHF